MNISLDFWSANGIGWLMIKTLSLPFLLMIALLFLERFIQEKRVKYYIRKNKIEFLTPLFAIFGYIVNYLFSGSQGVSLFVNIVITFIALIVIIYAKTKEKDFYFVSLQKPVDREDWIGDGIFQYDRVHDGYMITNSFLGFIYSKCLIWSDYTLEFESKILNTSLGVTLRATNLSNFIMLQVFETGIKPHIWINGFWQAWEPAEANLVFNKKLNSDKWYKFKFQCDKSSIRIMIANLENQIIFDRVWKIPAGNIYYKAPENSGIITKGILSSIPFPINLEYGTIGFRNNGEEKAIIRDVLVQKLQGNENGN
jgi:hypothetical protein